MRGLVVTGGRAPMVRLDITDRSQWLVVAADSGLDVVDGLGLYPDAIVGDMDSVSNDAKIDEYVHAVVQRHPRDKDRTDTEIAMDYAWDRGAESVTIVGGGGGRLDHLIGILSLFERPRHPDRWITHRDEVTAIDDRVEIQGTVGEPISFFPVGSDTCRASTVGLRWPLDDLQWHRGDIGVSNEFASTTCRIAIKTGRLIMVRGLHTRVALP